MSGGWPGTHCSSTQRISCLPVQSSRRAADALADEVDVALERLAAGPEQLVELRARQERVLLRQQHAARDVVLDEAARRLAVARAAVLLVGVDDDRRLGRREQVLRAVAVHLVAVKVGVVDVAVGVVHAQHLVAVAHGCDAP